MSTAFVLSGGGSLGAVQVGMLQALSDHGIEPDLLVGTSAGAMNAAWVAGHGTSPASLAGLESVWTRLRRSDVLPLDARTALRGLLGRSPALTSPTRLRDLVAACAPRRAAGGGGDPRARGDRGWAPPGEKPREQSRAVARHVR